jgi:hypothetical protein
MSKRLQALILPLLLTIVMSVIISFYGCARQNKEGVALKAIKIEATGPSGSGLSGTIRASNASTAGMTSKDFEIKIPGFMEVKGGPSEYEIIFRGLPSNVLYKITVDGRELKRGSDMIVDDDKGPRAVFTVK